MCEKKQLLGEHLTHCVATRDFNSPVIIKNIWIFLAKPQKPYWGKPLNI